MRTVQELMSLEGRAALITGGAGHIGRAIADAFLEAGGTVALADYRTPEDQQLKKARTSFLAVDLQDESATRELAARAARTMGRLDILVHCAALVGTDDLAGWAVPLPQQSTEAWDRAMRVNLTAAFTLAQTARPFLEQSGGGAIVFVSSIYGVCAPDPAMYAGTSLETPAAYSVTKAGLIQLARHLASYYAPGVRVNALSPGGVERNQPAPFVERYTARTPLKRMAREEDLKGAAVYLASDLSAYVTGQNLIVDGGWTLR